MMMAAVVLSMAMDIPAGIVKKIGLRMEPRFV
ncbi:hypothetical protein FSU_1755 [Fibrobacter succinogenes subsp. succinogenes S85]|uniref:Uncharacterized protein n=1 Tax=Fibrobacter succinogenes (strain ATCC 19169 / S85) TaxID=59374 RepID=D9SB21_FIBSS|nr:hypothetical protein FSU_1755 [Fibrobacter succinogenes subsp. succinogenes S85]